MPETGCLTILNKTTPYLTSIVAKANHLIKPWPSLYITVTYS